MKTWERAMEQRFLEKTKECPRISLAFTIFLHGLQREEISNTSYLLTQVTDRKYGEK